MSRFVLTWTHVRKGEGSARGISSRSIPEMAMVSTRRQRREGERMTLGSQSAHGARPTDSRNQGRRAVGARMSQARRLGLSAGVPSGPWERAGERASATAATPRKEATRSSAPCSGFPPGGDEAAQMGGGGATWQSRRPGRGPGGRRPLSAAGPKFDAGIQMRSKTSKTRTNHNKNARG